MRAWQRHDEAGRTQNKMRLGRSLKGKIGIGKC